MLLEQQGHPQTTAPNGFGTQASAEFWLQESTMRGSRRAIIHVADCPVSSARWNTPTGDKWHGPFAALSFVREKSDGLSGIAIRAECRCVRRGVETDLPRMALLNEPLFRKPKPVPTQKETSRESVRTAIALRKKPRAKKKLSKSLRYAMLTGTVCAVFAIALFCLPAISVVNATVRSSSPFLVANGGYLPITNLTVDCSVELQPAAVRLQSSHQRLADRLSPKDEVSVPCFQSVGGAIPQTSGMAVQVKLSYALLGIRHLAQSFTFVATRNQNGVCRWAEKSSL